MDATECRRGKKKEKKNKQNKKRKEKKIGRFKETLRTRFGVSILRDVYIETPWNSGRQPCSD